MKIPTTTEFCFITPISYLQYAKRSSRHLVLAHLVEQSLIYADFYKKMSDRGDYVMMDCSTYELHEPYSPEKLVSLGKQCGAHAIVLPDYPFQPAAKTVGAAEKFIPIFKNEGYHTFFVPQSQKDDICDWIDAYKYASSNPDIDIIGMSILGIPAALSDVSPAYARVVMTSILNDRGILSSKYHHYLGLNSGPGLEIPSLLKLGVLNSIDSSGPVWAGIHGHSYTVEADSLQQVKKLKSVVDFNIPMTNDKQTLNRIENNIQLTLNLFERQSQEVWYAKE